MYNTSDIEVRIIENAAIVIETKQLYESRDIQLLPLTKTRGIVPFGDDNDLPEKILEAAGKNPIVTACLEHKNAVTYGQGVKYGYLDETSNFIEKNDNLEINSFFENNDINGVLAEMITDAHTFKQANVEIILNQEAPASRKVIGVQHLESVFSRWETANPDTGIIENLIYSTSWEEGVKEENSSVIPVLNAKNPYLDLARKIGREPDIAGKSKDEKRYKYVIPIKLPSLGRKYYPLPSWYSIIESGWLDFANAIPTFKKAMMNNAMSVVYHVEINANYLPRIFSEEQITDPKLKQARKVKLYQDIDKFLKGEKNAGKSLKSQIKYSPDGKTEERDIKITVIDRKIGGEYLEDSQESSAMIYTAMNVNPSLIGVIPGKTASLSGSDKRELLRIEQTLQSAMRDRLLSFLYVIKKINKWDEKVVFRIPDMILTTLDSGREVQKITN